MNATRSIRGFLGCSLAAVSVLAAATAANAQFSPSANESFDYAGSVPAGVDFSRPNWSLDSGCSAGVVISEGTRQSDGAAAMKFLRGGTGTRMVMDLNPGSASSTIGDMMTCGNDVITRLLFSADAGAGPSGGSGPYGTELFRAYQVLYPTVRLESDIQPGATGSNPANMFRMSTAGNVLFSADDGTNGTELWKFQTGVNFFNNQLQMVKDINPTGSSNPSGFTNTTSGTVVVFAADDGVAGRELWKTDGVLGGAGTTILMDINQTPDVSASSNPEQFTPDAGGATALAYFTADNGVNGRELWRTNGTLAGTGMLKDIVAGATGSNPTNLAIGGTGTLSLTLFFTVDSDGANGMELWRSNGALDGSNTVMIKDVGGSPAHFKAVGAPVNLMFFILGNALWKSDGTDPGTVAVQTFSSISGPLVAAGDFVYFAADDGGGAGVELWRSNGTTTSMVADINPGGSSSPANLFNQSGTVYFSADDGTHGRELWRTTSAPGATLIKDINPGSASSNPSNFRDFSGTVAFTANDGTHGTELWQTDGSDLPARRGVGHTWDLVPVIQSYPAGVGKTAVAGTDTGPLMAGFTLDAPTVGGGNNHNEARQAVHQINFLVEYTNGADRAPIVFTQEDCADGSGFTRPKASLSGDGQPHAAIAVGLLAVLDQAPCDTSPIGPQSPANPIVEVPVVYDGLNWHRMDLATFPNLQSVAPFRVDQGNYLTNGLVPPGLAQATVSPFSTKRYTSVRLDILADSIRVLWHKRQGSNDPAPGDTTWMVTLPRQYLGAFRAFHLGTPNCVPSSYDFFVDRILLSGGLFTDSLTPFGSCCAPAGCSEVTDPAQCPTGTFSPWKSCAGVLCCPKPWADSDRDGDVDLDDYGAFQACYTGPTGPVPAGCKCLNRINDTTIDNNDLDEFKDCVTGPKIPFNPGSPPAGCDTSCPSGAVCPP